MGERYNSISKAEQLFKRQIRTVSFSKQVMKPKNDF